MRVLWLVLLPGCAASVFNGRWGSCEDATGVEIDLGSRGLTWYLSAYQKGRSCDYKMAPGYELPDDDPLSLDTDQGLRGLYSPELIPFEAWSDEGGGLMVDGGDSMPSLAFEHPQRLSSADGALVVVGGEVVLDHWSGLPWTSIELRDSSAISLTGGPLDTLVIGALPDARVGLDRLTVGTLDLVVTDASLLGLGAVEADVVTLTVRPALEQTLDLATLAFDALALGVEPSGESTAPRAAFVLPSSFGTADLTATDRDVDVVVSPNGDRSFETLSVTGGGGLLQVFLPAGAYDLELTSSSIDIHGDITLDPGSNRRVVVDGAGWPVGIGLVEENGDLVSPL